MRPEKLNHEMYLAFRDYFHTRTIDRFKKLLPELKRIWPKYAKENDDYRSGEETYGYKYDDQIQTNMAYISDRWNCAFRVKWLIDGLETKRIKI